MESTPVFCTECGQSNPPHAAFCGGCGAKLFKGDEDEAAPVAAPGGVIKLGEQDFVPLTCPSCGGKLEVGPDVHRLTCLNCGTTHDVLRDNPIPVLRPIISQINKVSEQLGTEAQVRAQTAQVSGETYAAVSNQAAVIQQAHAQEQAMQEILFIQQDIAEKQHAIKEMGDPKADSKIGWVLAGVFFTAGIIIEIIAHNDPSYIEVRGFAPLLFSMIAGMILIGMFINSLTPNSQKARKLHKEIIELQTKVDRMQANVMIGQPGMTNVAYQTTAVKPAYPVIDPTKSAPIKPPSEPGRNQPKMFRKD